MRNFTVIPEADFASEMDRRVDPFLESVRTDGTFRGCDGKALCWHSFAAGSPVANVVILHGYTESGEKYREMSWYFLSQGYSVWLYDQRGHGKSCRDVPDKTLTHVDSFDDYVGALECFLEQIVPRDLPLFLYSHSMGVAVSALTLQMFVVKVHSLDKRLGHLFHRGVRAEETAERIHRHLDIFHLIALDFGHQLHHCTVSKPLLLAHASQPLSL